MPAVRTRRPLQTGGSAWGPRRVALGLSLRQLAKMSGVARGMISLMERGRMVPTGEEYTKIMDALARIEAGEAPPPWRNA